MNEQINIQQKRDDQAVRRIEEEKRITKERAQQKQKQREDSQREGKIQSNSTVSLWINA